MRGSRPFLAVVVLSAAAVVGCGGDVPALEAAEKQLLADREELTRIAASADESKAEIARLQTQLEGLSGAGAPEPVQVETIRAAVKSVRVEEPEEGGFRLSWPGRLGTLERIAEAAPFLPTATLVAAAPRWSLEVPLSDATVPHAETAPREFGTAVIPPKPPVRSLRSARLRTKLAALQAEIAELIILTASIRELDARKAELRAGIDRANRPDRLRAVARAAAALFGGTRPPCRGGSIRTSLEKLTFECAAALDGKRAADAIAASVPDGWALEPDPEIRPREAGRPETVAGAFTLAPPPEVSAAATPAEALPTATIVE